MRLSVTVKQAGARKSGLTSQDLDVSDGLETLAALIADITARSADAYNRKPVDASLVSFLTGEQIEKHVPSGKVGFSRRFGGRAVNRDEAVRNALQCFQDGLFRVFIDEREMVSLSDKLDLREGAAIVFVRLTMLAGRMW